jgi:hypothetical protein
MIRIQTFGLLADIQRRVRARGGETVSWGFLEAFAAPMKIKTLPEALAAWAQANEMSIEFGYDTGRHIASATFHASR